MFEQDIMPGTLLTDTDAPKNAWLAPDGRAYYADDYGHNDAALILGDDTGGCALEDAGWLHVSRNLQYVCNITLVNVTQAQRDTMFDWMMSLVRREREGTLVYWQRDALSFLQKVI